jgi:Host cell surface-exposed lipoprotein
MKKVLLFCVLGVVAIVSVAACTAQTEPAAESSEPAKTVTVTEEAEPVEEAVLVEEAEPVEEEAPAETAGQENARRSAEDYLDYSAFSRKGLIEQLEYEGYSTKDATYAVDAVSPNWKEQAAKAAKDYLESSSFSRSGLIEQLEYEGYTEQQAVYGVNQAGL